MKTAISVPDDLFKQADRLAKRLKKSRSRLYADALRAYLARLDPPSADGWGKFADDLDKPEWRAWLAEGYRNVRKLEW